MGYSSWGHRVGHNWSDLECISHQAYVLLVTKTISKQISQVSDYSAFPCIRSCKKQGSLRKAKVIQSCPTVCNPMDCTVHGILQARILEQAAVPFSRGSSQTRDQTQISHTAGGFFPSELPGKSSLKKNSSWNPLTYLRACWSKAQSILLLPSSVWNNECAIGQAVQQVNLCRLGWWAKCLCSFLVCIQLAQEIVPDTLSAERVLLRRKLSN